MKTTLLAMALVLGLAVGGFAVSAGVGTWDLYGRANQICPTVVPFDSVPLYVDGGGNMAGCLVDWAGGLTGSDWLQRLNPVTQSTEQFLIEWGTDTGMLAGEGYMAWADSAVPTANPIQQYTYQGADISDTDLWISLPGAPPENGGPGGTHWIGLTYPANKTIQWTDIVITDGSEAWTLLDIATGAASANALTWLKDYNFMFLDRATQNTYKVPDEWGLDMYGGQMYSVWTAKNNLALIIPHPL